jgi:4-aminobutyrate aminotransferase-like enzyme
VVRFLPPLNIKETDLEEALEMIGDALDGLYSEETETAE